MGPTQASFVPGKGAIHLRFVSGNDGFAPIPEAIAAADFHFRFAVVQDSAVEGCGEMYFDERLWRSLLDFVKKYGTDIRVIGIGPRNDFDELPIEEFLKRWDGVAPDEKDPPWSVLVWQDKRLTIGMVADNWAAVGGPWPYSDSHTYSMYSSHALSDDILRHLRTSDAAERWSFDLPITDVPAAKIRKPPIAPGKFARFLSRWRGPKS